MTDPYNSQREIEGHFPGLVGTTWRLTSPQDRKYNCIAHAADVDNRFVWPAPPGYWPPDLPAQETVEGIAAFYRSIGFDNATSDALESGVTKVALFARQAVPRHAARQTSDGSWTSKLGQEWDILHELRALEGDWYGMVVQFLKIDTRTFLRRRRPPLGRR